MTEGFDSIVITGIYAVQHRYVRMDVEVQTGTDIVVAIVIGS
jgi:hypothetical protein